MKKSVLLGGVLGAILLASAAESRADGLVARVNISTQTMTVSRYGEVLYRWDVSTARKGYVTPSGSWKPKRLHKMWYSKKYDNSPMPWSVFYNGGYAVHGTNAVRQLGRPASHGCVRLATANAATFYSLVREVGINDTRIVVTY
ncbi:MAG: L,D-transpeptidase [Aquamicrobium sp.]|jgi:lipoprotein-anchoring transpeptidase ErfK/SrfK|uniref:L,D-transpeptidase n=1 Tax=Mesorhizobium amorphae TaxID=71433 RepID=UPI001181FB57|nr:L,D-transpeptidase [Mesorhizobium amorphae]MBR2688644.1 L,D-transpeptidase [Aquamicrobium sp.]